MKFLSSFLLFLCSPVFALQRTKFQHWFPQYNHHWVKAAQGPCQQQILAYVQNNRTQCHSPCACAADCILQNITGTIQSNFASAQVLLGLIPVTFGLIGPTITEIAVLSTHSPLISILLAIGSPAISVLKPFSKMNVLEPLSAPQSVIFHLGARRIATNSALVRVLIEGLIFAVAFMAIGLNIRTSIYVDMRTISGWRCATLYLPLVWSTLAVFVHGCGMLAMRARLGKLFQIGFGNILRSQSFWLIETSKDCVVSEALFWLSSLFSIGHLTFGILVLSSLMFISALEALQMFSLYAVSAALCKLVLLLKLSSIRLELDAK